MQLLLCYDNEGVYVNTYGKVSKNIVLQWGELPTSVAYIGTGQIMGWGNKAIEIRSVESGHLDGVFMHKKAQKLKFLCERNDKVFFSSAKGGSSCQIYFMTLNKPGMANWWSGRGNLTNFFMSGHTPPMIFWWFAYKPRILVKFGEEDRKKREKKNDKLVVQYN